MKGGFGDLWETPSIVSSIEPARSQQACPADHDDDKSDLPEWHQNELEFCRIAKIKACRKPLMTHHQVSADQCYTDSAK